MYLRSQMILNTNQLKPHLSKYWCIPMENDPHFIANMEDILTIYQKPYDPCCPVACMDEKPVSCLMRPGSGPVPGLWKPIPKRNCPAPGRFRKLILSMSAWGHPAYSCSQSRSADGGIRKHWNTGKWATLQK